MSTTSIKANRKHKMHADPTAESVINKIDRERMEEETRFRDLLATILYISDLAGFEIVGDIGLKDLKTGKVWR